MELKGLDHSDDAVQPFWDEFETFGEGVPDYTRWVATRWMSTQWALFGTGDEQALNWVKDLGDVHE